MNKEIKTIKIENKPLALLGLNEFSTDQKNIKLKFENSAKPTVQDIAKWNKLMENNQGLLLEKAFDVHILGDTKIIGIKVEIKTEAEAKWICKHFSKHRINYYFEDENNIENSITIWFWYQGKLLDDDGFEFHFQTNECKKGFI